VAPGRFSGPSFRVHAIGAAIIFDFRPIVARNLRAAISVVSCSISIVAVAALPVRAVSAGERFAASRVRARRVRPASVSPRPAPHIRRPCRRPSSADSKLPSLRPHDTHRNNFPSWVGRSRERKRDGLMKICLRACLGVAAVGAVAAACSSSGSNAAGMGADGGGSGSSTGSGGVIYSCLLSGDDLCNQIVGTPGSASGEQSGCAALGGTTGSGCPMTGVVGYCDMGVGGTQYVYSASEAQIVQGLCAMMNNGTWVGVDGGGGVGGDSGGSGDSGGAAAFIGAWLRSGSQTTTCEGGSPTMITFAGTLTITAGSSPDTIIGTQPDGCVTDYTVSDNVATATPGQICNVTTDAGMEKDTVVSHTLTLSADGATLTSTSTTSIDETATMTMCTATATGTYTLE